MRPDEKKDDAQLRAWTSGIVEREQQNETYGKVIVHMEKGRIVRVTTEKIELPVLPGVNSG